jgi:hypothetical protein
MGLARQFTLGTQKGTRLKSVITLMGKMLDLVSLTPEKPWAFLIVTTAWKLSRYRNAGSARSSHFDRDRHTEAMQGYQ